MRKLSDGIVGKAAGIGASLLGLVVMNSACYKIDVNVLPPIVEEMEETPEVSEEEDLVPSTPLFNASIDVWKDNYAVGERFRGNSHFEFSGEPFEGIMVGSNTRLGSEEIFHSTFKTEFLPGERKPSGLQAFHFNEDELGHTYFCCKESFAEPGFYKFGMDVYSCDDVEEVLGVGCEEIVPRTIERFGLRDYVTPLASAEKVVSVE
jgi:hypothetical protein